MFFPILNALGICLFTIPVIWEGIANRISAKQKSYVRDNKDIIKAAAELWRLNNPAAKKLGNQLGRRDREIDRKFFG